MSDVKHSEVWEAVRRQAQLWAQAPAVRIMAASLPDNAPLRERRHDAATVASLLQELRAGGAALFSRPMLLGRLVPFLIQGGWPLAPGPRVEQSVLDEWLGAALAVEDAHRVTLAWTRSRLPAYPILRVPQLAPDTHLTTQSYSTAITWPRNEFGVGHQFDPAPRNVPRALGATGDEVRLLEQAAQHVAAALEATSEWQGFDAVRCKLNDRDREVLLDATRILRVRLARIDEAPGQSIFERDAFRRQQTREAVQGLDGNPRRYCEAFDAVNSLIELCVGDVFGQLTLYGDPHPLKVSQIDFPGPGQVRVVTDDLLASSPGNIVRVDDPLVTDALRVESVTSKLDLVAERPSTLTLRVLEGTSVWFAGP